MNNPELSAEDQEIFNHSIESGSVLQSTNGSQELRDALKEQARIETTVHDKVTSCIK